MIRFIGMYEQCISVKKQQLPPKTAISRQIFLTIFFAEVDIFTSVVKCYSSQQLKIGDFQRFIGAI